MPKKKKNHNDLAYFLNTSDATGMAKKALGMVKNPSCAPPNAKRKRGLFSNRFSTIREISPTFFETIANPLYLCAGVSNLK